MADDDRSERQIARQTRRKAGDRSAKLAATLMKLSDASVKKLSIDEDLADAIARARAVTSLIARRRAERTLAGDLRRFELDALITQLDNLDANRVDVQLLHRAEEWRTRLIESDAAIAEVPGDADDELPRLVAAARRERDTGRPPGAARALFRYLARRLA